jgi:hypothetical protein
VGVAVPMTELEFRDLLYRVEDGLPRIEREAQRFYDNVERWLHWLGPFGGSVRSVLNSVRYDIEAFVREVGEFLANPGEPWTLWDAGTIWAGAQVAGRVSAQVAKSTLDEVRVDDFWEGAAADAYKNTLPRQKEALAAVTKAADQVDDALTKVAFAICAFWLAILAVMVEFVLAIASAAGISVTGVGAPAAVGAVAVEVAKALGVLVVTATAFLAVANAAASSVKDLQHGWNDSAAFPDQRWPRSTTDISNGRISDGRPSGWRIRQ